MPYSVQATFYAGTISDFSYLVAIFISHGAVNTEFVTTDFSINNNPPTESYFKSLGWGGWLSFQYDQVPAGFRGSVILYDSDADVVMAVLNIQPNIDEIPAQILKLVGANQVVDTFSYDPTTGDLTSCNIKTYDTAANAQAGGSTGLLRTYTLANVYTSGQLTKQTTSG